jgi:hypothetical protein
VAIARRCPFCMCEPIYTSIYTTVFKKRPIFLNSAPTSTERAQRVLGAPSVCLVKQMKCLSKIFTKFAAKFHTHTHTHTHRRCSSSSFIVTLSLIRRKVCAHAQFSGCSSTTNAHSETGQTAVCYQNLMLGALSSRSALSALVGSLFKKFCLFLNIYIPTLYVSVRISKILLHLTPQFPIAPGHRQPRAK